LTSQRAVILGGEAKKDGARIAAINRKEMGTQGDGEEKQEGSFE